MVGWHHRLSGHEFEQTLGDSEEQGSLACWLPSGSYVPGILQARILGELPFPPPGDLPDPGMEPVFPASPALAGGFFTQCHLESPVQSIDHSRLPGSVTI